MALLSLLFVGSLWGGFKGLGHTEKILGQQLPVSLVSSSLSAALLPVSMESGICPPLLSHAPSLPGLPVARSHCSTLLIATAPAAV